MSNCRHVVHCLDSDKLQGFVTESGPKSRKEAVVESVGQASFSVWTTKYLPRGNKGNVEDGSLERKQFRIEDVQAEEHTRFLLTAEPLVRSK